MAEFEAAFTVAIDAFDVFDSANNGVIVLSEVRETLSSGTPETLIVRARCAACVCV